MGPYDLLLSVLIETSLTKAPHGIYLFSFFLFLFYLCYPDWVALLVNMIQHCHLLVNSLKTLFWVGLKYINYWKQSKRLAWNELTKLNGPLVSKSQHIFSQHSSVKTKLRDSDPASEGFLKLTDEQNEHEVREKMMFQPKLKTKTKHHNVIQYFVSICWHCIPWLSAVPNIETVSTEGSIAIDCFTVIIFHHSFLPSLQFFPTQSPHVYLCL